MGRQVTRQGTLITFSGTLSLFLGGCLSKTWCVYCTDVLSDLGGVGGWSRPDPEQLPDPTKGPDKKNARITRALRGRWWPALLRKLFDPIHPVFEYLV